MLTNWKMFTNQNYFEVYAQKYYKVRKCHSHCLSNTYMPLRNSVKKRRERERISSHELARKQREEEEGAEVEGRSEECPFMEPLPLDLPPHSLSLLSPPSSSSSFSLTFNFSFSQKLKNGVSLSASHFAPFLMRFSIHISTTSHQIHNRSPCLYESTRTRLPNLPT